MDKLTESGGIKEATKVLRMMSHEDRLRVLCFLCHDGELSVGQLLKRVELSGSALSQHLAKLREHGLVATRREKQSVYYRVGRDDVREMLVTLYGLYCK